ncbi:MAG: transcription antitermination factor NusB [Cyanobacteria bacterium HKST-UBA04]|nr:transcription antitermination factor NusB [Cyanobacteria bacterium HKST-UBA04]
MKARSVARQLAFFMLYQAAADSSTTVPTWSAEDLDTRIVETVRALSDMAKEQMDTAGSLVASLLNTLEDHELGHPDNADVPFDEMTKPVPIPTTETFKATLHQLLAAVENVYEALDLPEIKALGLREDVNNYTRMLLKSVNQNHQTIDTLIDTACTDWKLERLNKPDATLLRLATAEMMATRHRVDTATVVDETLELAKRFCDDDSVRFVHGVLGQIVQLMAEGGGAQPAATQSAVASATPPPPPVTTTPD